MEKKVVAVFAKNDHRQINKDLKFFTFLKEVGSSLPVWLPRGTTVKRLIKDFLYQLEKEHGFIFVTSPVLANQEIYQTSGHLQHYQEYMFPEIKVSQQSLLLRPMTCPHHCLIFASQNYSYQDLPIRMSEDSLLFRCEKSGASHGLERVRQMELKDAHIFTINEQSAIEKEVRNCFVLTQKVLERLEIQIDRIDLSLHDPVKTKKYYSAPKLWQETESLLIQLLTKMQVPFQKIKGEAAFYGPKIDFQVKTLMGHNLTVSTIQLDFLLAKKFQLKYRTAKQGPQQQFATPIIIHHGIIGTYERLVALLMEQKKGWLPFWLAPTQIMIFLVQKQEDVVNYWKKVVQFCQSNGLRVIAVDLKKKLSENVKKSWLLKVPVQVFIGQKELTKKQVTYSHFLTSQEKKTGSIFQFLDYCKQLNDFN